MTVTAAIFVEPARISPIETFLSEHPTAICHVIEPSPKRAQELYRHFQGRVVVHEWRLNGADEFSCSLCRKKGGLNGSGDVRSIDHIACENDIQRLALLSFGNSTALLEKLAGAAWLLEGGGIDVVEWTGSASSDVGTFLRRYGYRDIAEERAEDDVPYRVNRAVYDGRKVLSPTKLTMSTLGTNGRFANQLYQYAMVHLCGHLHGFQIETSDWIGKTLFGLQETGVTAVLPEIKEANCNFGGEILDRIGGETAARQIANHDLWGYFQYNSKFFAPHKKHLRSLFRPTLTITAKIEPALKELRSLGKTVVTLHLRRGDYGYGPFWIAPTSWYLKWLKGYWVTLDQPVLYIASDSPEQVTDDFAEYKPVDSRAFANLLPECPYYTDFWLLSQGDILGISNSSFSFFASMLNERAHWFFRPDQKTEQMIPYDPWCAHSTIEGKG